MPYWGQVKEVAEEEEEEFESEEEEDEGEPEDEGIGRQNFADIDMDEIFEEE